MRQLDDRATRLFIALAAFFCVNAVLAEFIGVKIFSLEATLGIAPVHWRLLGEGGTLDFTAGTVIWPIVFIMTDTVNEYFGKRGVRLISWLAAGLIAYAFLFAFIAIQLAPASWWVASAQTQGVPDYQAAYAAIFGQGMWITVGSLVAFLIGQLVDIHVFHQIRRRTGERHAWLRATGSTMVSQLVDSFVVLYIAFVLGPAHWPMSRFLAVASLNYTYKLLAAVALIPLLYLARAGIHRYLGEARAAQLIHAAAHDHAAAPHPFPVD
ncbi:queuosine precursor transporter [Thermomonas sp.]|uniref:queuosine precursor transporter n=1 Tax=Thermomonas sp. TaxID=1971895 RepID=UPI003919EEF6